MGHSDTRTNVARTATPLVEAGSRRTGRRGRATSSGRRTGRDRAQAADIATSSRKNARKTKRKSVKGPAKGKPPRGFRGDIQRSWMRAGKSARCAVLLAVGEWDHGGADLTVVESVVGGQGHRRSTRDAGGRTSAMAEAARMLAALGHPVRLAIMRKLLDGPATYAAMRKLTRLAAGPLYHHVGALRLAGLLMPKQRDLYELTRGGRNMILLAMTLPVVGRDRRRRPVGVA